MRAGNDCIFGASISEKADTEGLKEAYGHFVSEVEEIDSSYNVESVNTDGWSATVCAWKALYPDNRSLLPSWFHQDTLLCQETSSI